MNYRFEAEKSLARAKNELETGDDTRLKYAALELRMSLEALIYQKAQLYSEEVPAEVLAVWQPRKLLGYLLEIDPYADQSSSLAVGIQKEHGVPPEDMQSLGTDRNLSLKEVKKYYDRLGSYLHKPTIQQLEANKVTDFKKVRKRCAELVEILNEVFMSPIFNSNFKHMCSLSCLACGQTIHRRVPLKDEEFTAKCIKCPATYSCKKLEDGSVNWTPRIHEIGCPQDGCEEKMNLWDEELKLGSFWDCSGCGKINSLSLCVTSHDKSKTDS